MDTEGPPIEREFRRRLLAVGPIARAELLRVLTMSRKKRAQRIGALYQLPTLQTSAELLIDIEDDPATRAIVLAELRIMEREDAKPCVHRTFHRIWVLNPLRRSVA